MGEEAAGTPWFTVPVSRWADRPEPGRQHRVQVTRRRLLLAAARQFDSDGYHGSSLRDILTATGLTKGALYFHFRSKAELAVAVIRECVDSWVQVETEVGARGLDPVRRLLVETDAWVARWMYDPVVRGASRAMTDGIPADAYRSWTRAWSDGTEAHLGRARAAGLLRPEVDIPRLSRLLLAAGAGHHVLGETLADEGDLWARMSDTWEGILPVVVVDDWVEQWRCSGWADRPAPCADVYERARRPEGEQEQG